MDDQCIVQKREAVVCDSRVMTVEAALWTQDALKATKRGGLVSGIAPNGELKHVIRMCLMKEYAKGKMLPSR